MPKRNNKAYGAPRAPVAQRHGPVGAAVILDTESSKLLLSGESFASNREKLQAAGVTAIIACGCRCHFVDTFTYLDVRLKDDSHAKAGRHLDPAADFIALHLAKGGTVLCHCKAGICRSTTMVMAYLIKYRGLGVDEALAAVRQARRCANPRGEFVAALHSFAQRASWLQGQETSEAAVAAVGAAAGADPPTLVPLASCSTSAKASRRRDERATLRIVRQLRSGANLTSLCSAYKLTSRLHPHLPLVQLSYSQRESDLANEVVQECRGLILEKGSWRVVALPFTKFFNADEPAAAAVRKAFDWSTARVYEKLDGSIATLYHHCDRWHVSSMRVPDAAGEVPGVGVGTFASHFWETFAASGYRLPEPTGRCYTFELCLPGNTIVVRHSRASLTLIGARDLTTLVEEDVEEAAAQLGWAAPRKLPGPHDLTSVKAAACALNPVDQEGFVCVDSAFRRIKVKSPGYVALHRLPPGEEGVASGGGADPRLQRRRLLEVARCREGDEFLSYFPRLRPLYDEVAADLRRLSLTGGAEWVRDAPIGEVEAAIEAARRLPPPEETAGAVLHAVAGQPLLLTLVGLPGSGKTTLCGQLGEAVGRRLRHVSQDECGTRRLCIEAATEALRAGRSVIIDRCNADPAQREPWVALGREHGCVVASVHLDLPVEECLGRVMVRRRHPTLPAGERAAAVVHKFASELSRPAPSEGFDAALVATTVDEAKELVGTLTQAIICATSIAGVAGEEGEGNGGVSPDLTLAERRKHKAAVAKLRRSRRDIKFAATSDT